MEDRKIDVDEAVWELLKKSAESSSESPNDILKRLLQTQKKKEEAEQPKATKNEDWQCF